jgi:hypothetical protein
LNSHHLPQKDIKKTTNLTGRIARQLEFNTNRPKPRRYLASNQTCGQQHLRPVGQRSTAAKFKNHGRSIHKQRPDIYFADLSAKACSAKTEKLPLPCVPLSRRDYFNLPPEALIKNTS